MRRRTGKYIIGISVIVLMLSKVGTAQTLKPGDWYGEEIRFLQNRGYLWELSPTIQPYNASRIGLLLSQPIDKKSAVSPRVERFASGLQEFLAHTPSEEKNAFCWLNSRNAYQSSEGRDLYAGRQRGTFGLRLRPWLEVYDTVFLDNRLDENPSYYGKTQSGYASDTEQAFALATFKGLQLKVGRDYVRWGPGRDATLLISDYARPMDQIAAAYQAKWFSFSYFTATLDPTQYPLIGSDGKKIVSDKQNRYLSAHRLEVRPWRYLYLGISEAILYGGPDFGYDFGYLNPVIFYHGVLMNGPNQGNTIGSMSLTMMPYRGWQFYGELMIDDIQIEKEGPGDLEPSEIGYLIGANVADPFGFFGVDIYGEYTRITNRTYNTPNPWEKWLHRNQPIGHFLGNDFDRLAIGASYWPRREYKVALGYEHRRRGEGRIENAFDTPWMDVPVGQSYYESFPSGVMETTRIFRAEVQWQPEWWIRVGGSGRYWDIENHNNVKAISAGYWEWNLGIEFDWMKPFRIDTE